MNESHSVSGAGVILIWPFLERYFELLGLANGGNFTDFDARSRAAYLLHTLASGHRPNDEGELHLARVLCGVAFRMPLATSAAREIDDREQQISRQLLEAVISRIGNMRSTSVVGFRETFLMREGQLVPPGDDGKSWTLTVERKAYDPLLNSVPWEFSIVRLSWMEGLLKVQWPH